jgi:hypothetical protein
MVRRVLNHVFTGLQGFMEEYRARLLRINDRENHMFMQALVNHVNDQEFIGKLKSNQERRDVLELLIQNSDLFERGSAQYHTLLQVSDRYLEAIENSQQAYSLIHMSVVQDQSEV